MMDIVFSFLRHAVTWISQHPLGATDILFMSASAVTVFLCRYARRRDSVVGTILFICWVYKIYETVTGGRISAPSDVLFSGVIFTVIFSAGGNIMSVVVMSHLADRFKSIWSRVRRPFTFKVKK